MKITLEAEGRAAAQTAALINEIWVQRNGAGQSVSENILSNSLESSGRGKAALSDLEKLYYCKASIAAHSFGFLSALEFPISKQAATTVFEDAPNQMLKRHKELVGYIKF